MTRTKKLFLAAALLAVGFGVASLLGSPNAPYLPRLTARTPRAVPMDVHDGTNRVIGGVASAESAGARLVPDVPLGFGDVPKTAAKSAETDSITPLLLTTNAEAIQSTKSRSDDPAFRCDGQAPPLLETSSVGRVAFDGESLTAAAPTIEAANPSPTAKLLAVRPLPNGDNAWRGAAENVTVRSTPVLSPSDIAVAGFTSPAEPWLQATAVTRIAATTQTGMETALKSPSTSAQEPAREVVRTEVMADDVELRTHIVIDGDSLPRLAGRYLDDPQRSGEIFELNRERLENPELLPIGLELKIPNRDLPQSGSIADVPREASLAASRSAGLGGMLPVPPIPPITTVKPRAQLLQPLPTGLPRDRLGQ